MLLENVFSCLVDADLEKYDQKQTFENWDETFGRRIKRLAEKEGKKETLSIQQYFQSFAAIHSPLGIALVCKRYFFTFFRPIFNFGYCSDFLICLS